MSCLRRSRRLAGKAGSNSPGCNRRRTKPRTVDLKGCQWRCAHWRTLQGYITPLPGWRGPAKQWTLRFWWSTPQPLGDRGWQALAVDRLPHAIHVTEPTLAMFDRRRVQVQNVLVDGGYTGICHCGARPVESLGGSGETHTRELLHLRGASLKAARPWVVERSFASGKAAADSGRTAKGSSIPGKWWCLPSGANPRLYVPGASKAFAKAQARKPVAQRVTLRRCPILHCASGSTPQSIVDGSLAPVERLNRLGDAVHASRDPRYPESAWTLLSTLIPANLRSTSTTPRDELRAFGPLAPGSPSQPAATR